MGLFSGLFAAAILAILYAAWQGIVALRASWRALRAIEGSIHQFEFPTREPLPLVDDPRIEALQTKINELTLAVSDGIQRAHRSENRVRAIVTGARRELAEHGLEHAGVEAEAGELREIDGNPGDDEPLPAVPDDMGNGAETPSAIPGVTVGQLRTAWRHRR